MPITIQLAAHPATIIPTDKDKPTPNPLEIVTHILEETAPANRRTTRSHIQSSFHPSPNSPVLQPDSNGFIHTITRAYNNHHHITIRPDDIWMSIISQFSFYVNAHAEDLRGKFVAHEGKVSLKVVYGSGSRFTVPIDDFTAQIADLIQQNIVDPDLRAWLLPKFTTTTDDDTIAMSIVMMGTLQKYFEYGMTVMCGIPSVTLLGEKKDYEEILARLGKLSEYGEEPTEFGAGLVPVLEGIIRTFDDPEAKEVKRFWETICDYRGGSGVSYYSGWVTAFCYWDDQGVRIRRVGNGNQVDAGDIPGGFVTVPLDINDNGEEVDGELLAGSVAIECSSSGKLSTVYGSYEGEMEVGLDSMQPRIGWFLYEKQK